MTFDYEETDSRMFKFNEYQTDITSAEDLDKRILEILDKEELDEGYLREVKIEFFEIYDSIKFVQNLTSLDRGRAGDNPRWDRPYARDRSRNANGRIEVNITAPHVLENMDFFREASLTYQETGRYTPLSKQ